MANLRLLKKKILIAGANGLLGQKLVETFHGDYEVRGVGITPEPVVSFPDYEYLECDITRRKDITSVVKDFEPHYIVNAAAYTDVDGSEEDKETCWRVNVIGTENLAHAARTVAAVLVHISTDYVFDGVEGNYSEESTPNPLGYYGRSKLASENAVMGSRADYAILRTMILYGAGRDIRPNFATWLVEKLRKGEPVKIVDDQYGHPTLADDLAMATREIIEKNKTGLYHVAGPECVNRYNFALKLADVFGFDRSLIQRTNSSELNQKAPRPFKSSFDLSKLHKDVGVRLSGIEDGLKKLKQQLAA